MVAELDVGQERRASVLDHDAHDLAQHQDVHDGTTLTQNADEALHLVLDLWMASQHSRAARSSRHGVAMPSHLRAELGQELAVRVVPAAHGRLGQVSEARSRLRGTAREGAIEVLDSTLGAAVVHSVGCEDVMHEWRQQPARVNQHLFKRCPAHACNSIALTSCCTCRA